jgi:hypothetical protein
VQRHGKEHHDMDITEQKAKDMIAKQASKTDSEL